ncbi:hypothetical protein BDY24DRAFT_1155 [Mrakia frigida]|uniref:uncharacterized protein n=1 Tax=Mrakia frigida TaxID=29902 RepID=UPI003FCC1863
MSTVALTTVFSTSLSTALTPKTSVVESLITFHTTTAQVTVNEGSGRTQTDVNDLFNKVLTQTVVFQETQVFTTIVPIQTLFSTITSPTANVAAATTATRTILTTTAASSSTFSSSSSSSANAATSSPAAAASSAPTGTVAKEAAFQESSASDQAGGSSSTATARAQTTNSLPSSVPTNNSLTASSNTNDGTGSNSSSNPNGARTGAIVAAVLIVLLLLGFVAAGIWWFRRRRRLRKGGLTSGWMSQERTFTSLEDPDEKVAGRWMSGYGFGRGSTVGPTTWPEKSFIGKRRSSSLVPHIPTLSPVATPPLALPLPLDKSHNPFNDPLPPTKPVDAAASLPPSTLKKSNSIPRKTVPPVSPLHPFAPNPSKSTNREYFGPGGRHPIFAQLGMGSGGGGGGTPSDASLPDSNTSGSSLDDRHLSLTSTDRSSMSSNLQFHSSFTDSITIFHQIPSPEVSPTNTRAPPGPLRFDDIGPTTPNPFEDQPPIARIPRPRIPSITLTMATGSMYSSTTTVPSPSGTEDPFASRHDSLALTEEGETDSIRSSKSSSELPALFTTAESPAEEEERESPKSSSSPTPPSSSNFFPSPSTFSSSSSHSIKHPNHHHLPHQRPPPIQSSRLGASKPDSSSSSSDDSAQPPSPSFPYISKTSIPTSPATPSTAHGIRMVLQNDQRATSLYRDALEKRKTLAESVISNDSLDQLGSLLGHGEEGKRNGKWPRPPGEE